LFGPRVAFVGGLLCALSPTLISASTEAKQYGVEACMTCLVLLAALKWVEEASLGHRWYGLWALGIGGIWLAPSLVFVLAAIVVAVLLLDELEWRRRLQAAAQFALGWGISLAVAYWAVYAHASSASYLKRYWASAFLTPGRPGVLLDSAAAVRSVLWSPVFRDTFSGFDSVDSVILISAISMVLALTLLIGVRRLIRSSPAHVSVIVLLPPVLMVLASALRIYPVSARTTLFFLPVLIILFAAGLEELSRLAVRRSLAACILGAPAFLLLLVTKRDLFPADPRENVKPLLALLQSHRHGGEPVYVFAGAVPAWAFYTTNWRAPDSERLRFL
jgi:hypothetical protein